MSSELKACDFCGFTDLGAQNFKIDGSDRWGWVECGECEARGPSVYIASCRPGPWTVYASAAWNRRAPSPAVKALVEACRAIYHDEYFCEGMTLVQSGKILDMLTRLAAVEREIQQ